MCPANLNKWSTTFSLFWYIQKYQYLPNNTCQRISNNYKITVNNSICQKNTELLDVLEFVRCFCIEHNSLFRIHNWKIFFCEMGNWMVKFTLWKNCYLRCYDLHDFHCWHVKTTFIKDFSASIYIQNQKHPGQSVSYSAYQ